MTRLLVDKRVKKNNKLMISCIVGYIIMPLDLIPDFIPWIGYLDDFIITVLGVNYLINELDNKIILDNWPGKENIIDTIKMLNENLENKVETLLLRRIKKLFSLFTGVTKRIVKKNNKDQNK
jgi:uncharacterized membrane protein YkvA (DUF1232 family)